MIVSSLFIFLAITLTLIINIGIFPLLWHLGIGNYLLLSLIPDVIVVLFFMQKITIVQGPKRTESIAVTIGGILVGLLIGFVLYLILGVIVDIVYLVPAGLCMLGLVSVFVLFRMLFT